MSYLNSVFTCIALSDSLLIQNFLYLFPYFRHSSKKNIYLCHALSAHRRDETGGKCFLFPLWSK